MNGSEIRTGIKLTGDDSGLTAAFAAGEHAAQDFDKQVKQVGNSSGKLTSELGGVQRAIGQVISVAAAWQLGKLAMSSADDMSVLQSRLRLVTASTNELVYVQQRLLVSPRQAGVSTASWVPCMPKPPDRPPTSTSPRSAFST